MTKIILSSSFLLLPSLLLFLIGSSEADNITTYWGRDAREGSLKETCATRIYSLVSIASYWNYGDGRSPKLNLSGHCDPASSSGCTILGTDIKYCQKQGIKVLLFVTGDGWKNNISSSEDAQNLSDYLWSNFLGGSSSSRPFGDAILDGIDLDTRYSTSYWRELARHLKSHSTATQQVYLSASPPCPFRNYSLGTHFETSIFDYVWIQFYTQPVCAYSENNPKNFLTVWNQWTTSLNRSKVFLCLPASPEDGGYIPPYLFISEVLPIVRKSPKYGGVMMWTRYEDKLSEYSASIDQLSSLCTPQSAPKCRNYDRVFEERFGSMSTDSSNIYESESLGLQCCETICRNNCSCDAYAIVNTGCQIWGQGTRFIEAAGVNRRSIHVVRHVVKRKGMSSFPT